MPFAMEIDQGRQTLKLEGAVTIRNAEDLVAQAGGVLEQEQELWIETSALEDIDTSILQVLLALRKSTASLHIEAPSSAFVAAVERCGLRRELLNTKEVL